MLAWDYVFLYLAINSVAGWLFTQKTFNGAFIIIIIFDVSAKGGITSYKIYIMQADGKVKW